VVTNVPLSPFVVLSAAEVIAGFGPAKTSRGRTAIRTAWALASPSGPHSTLARSNDLA
jgi:hypothetical protein